MKDEIIFQGSGMNSDDDIRFFPKGDATTEGRLNCDVSEEGNYGLITNLKGNTKINFTFPEVDTWKVLGAAEDIENNRIIYLAKHITASASVYDRILARDIGSNVITDLTDELRTGIIRFGWIDDINNRLDVKVIDNQLIWTDNYNPPAKLNIDKISNYYFSVSDYSPWSLIKGNLFPEIRAYIVNESGSEFASSNYYQFAIQLEFDRYEQSVISGYSNIIKTTEGNSGKIGISFVYENFGNTIKAINILFKKNLSDNFSLAKKINVTTSPLNSYATLDVEVSAFSTPQTLTDTVAKGYKYLYYFDEQASFFGEIIDDRIADSVPLKSKTLDIVDNRLMLGNNLQGYDSVNLDGLTLSEITSSNHVYSSTFPGTYTLATNTLTVSIDTSLFPTAVTDGEVTTSFRYYVYISGDSTYKRIWFECDLAHISSEINTYFSDDILNNLKAYVLTVSDNVVELSSIVKSGSYLRVVIPGMTVGASVSADLAQATYWEDASTGMSFKSGSRYQIAGFFHDEYGRTSGAMINEDYIMNISNQKSSDGDSTIGFDWSFNSTTIASITPDWAKYFSFGISKCLDYSSVFQGAYGYKDTEFALAAPPNYSFEKGDVLRLLTGITEYTISEFQQTVDSDSRGWLIFSEDTYEDIKIRLTSYEVVRKKELADSFIFETSKKYIIDRLGGGTFSSILGDTGDNQGYFYGGDTFCINERFAFANANGERFFDESFSLLNGITPNILGKFIPDLSQFNQQRYQNIYWSGKFFDNTQVNGLNSFLGTDNTDLNDEFGQINKIMAFGDTLKVYQDKKVTSILAGKTNIYNADGSNNVASYNRALSDSHNPSFQNYGLQFTHAITGNKNQRYFYDTLNGVIVRDSRNGLFPISGRLLSHDVNMDYKMDKYFKNQSKTTIKTLVDDGELDNIHLTFDEENEMLYVFIKDTVDGGIKTAIFHEPSNRWVTLSDMNNSSGQVPEHSICLNNEFMTFMDGELWLQNSNETRCNFYGDQKDWICEAISNTPPNIVKQFNSINLHSNTPLLNNITVPSSPSYNEMESDLLEAQFELKENQYKSTYWKNKKTNQVAATTLDKFNGEDLRGYAVQNKLTKVNASSKIELFKVDIESVESAS